MADIIKLSEDTSVIIDGEIDNERTFILRNMSRTRLIRDIRHWVLFSMVRARQDYPRYDDTRVKFRLASGYIDVLYKYYDEESVVSVVHNDGHRSPRLESAIYNALPTHSEVVDECFREDRKRYEMRRREEDEEYEEELEEVWDEE
jgi:hypothetical protein